MKYTSEQLVEMANCALAACDEGDPRYTILVVRLCATFGMSPDEVTRRIELLSWGVTE